VVVPVRNGGGDLRRCLNCLTAARPAAHEVIVVLDGCDDDSEAIATRAGVRVLATPFPSGPAAARNLGARAARGDLLYFVDADVAVPPHALAEVLQAFEDEPEIAAVFGSYDDEPAHRNFASLYKNLLHHHVHQSGRDDASTFWSGSGAIRRDLFLRAGGFDERYLRPSIEDIELGSRLIAAGYRIRLRRSLQVKHLKRYALLPLLRSDIFDRAVPWSGLILRRREMPGDLNLDAPSRVSAALACAAAPCLALDPDSGIGIGLALGCIGGLVALNRRFYALVLRRAGWIAAAQAVVLHWLYFVYSAATFAVCATAHAARRSLAALPRARTHAHPPIWESADGATETVKIAANGD
jgi:glycosyltransferase involved in cell wall biosynthesis